MMNVLLIIFICVCCLGESYAQALAGPKLALNFANVIGNGGGQSNKFKFGYSAGFFLRVDLNETVGLQPEILYSTRGYKKSTSFGNLSNDTSIVNSFSYIDFPFLLDIAIGDAAFINVGTQIGFIIDARQKGTVTFVSNGNVQTQKIDTSNILGIRTMEYALALGGGYKFNFPMAVSLRFVYGFTNLYEENKTGHNIYFQFSTVYIFGNSNGRGGGRQGVIYKRLD
jgi:hypothetical protein